MPPLEFESAFDRRAFAAALPDEELAMALCAANRDELLIAGSVDRQGQTIKFVRGNFLPLIVPFSGFGTSGDGTEPDFGKFSITDFGHTVRFGEYEAAADAILYEFDAEYRQRVDSA